MGLFGKKKQQQPEGAVSGVEDEDIFGDAWDLVPEDASPVVWLGPETYAYNVVGESHYNANLRAILEDDDIDVEEGGEYETVANLAWDFRNQFDENAVAVVIDNRKVGYIPKEDARILCPRIQEMTKNGQMPLVSAVIGWKDPAIIGVRLDLKVE